MSSSSNRLTTTTTSASNSILTNNTNILNANSGNNSAANLSNANGSPAATFSFGPSDEPSSTSKNKTYTNRNSMSGNKNGGVNGHHHHYHHHSHNHQHSHGHQSHSHHHHHQSFSASRQGFSNNENANPALQEDANKRYHGNRRISGQKQHKSSNNGEHFAGTSTTGEFSSMNDLTSNENNSDKGSATGSDLRTMDEDKIKIPKDLREEDFDEEDYVLNEKVLSSVERLLYCTNPYSNDPAHDTYNSSFAHSHSLPQLPIYSYVPSFRSDLKFSEDDELAQMTSAASLLQMSESEANEVEFSLGSSASSSSSDLTKTKSKETPRKSIGMFNDFKLNPFHHQNMETFGRFIRQSLNLKNELANDIISNQRIQYWVERNRSHGFVYQTYPRIDETKKRVPSVRCELCKFYGHLSHTCSIREFAFKLNNVVLRNGATRCHICGQLGHPAEAGLCPYITCSFCSQNGHWNYMCPQKDKTSRTLCHKCQHYGHNTERCPDQWRQFDRISTFEQTSQRDPSETNKPVYCYQCAQKGHYGYNCPEFYRKYFIRDYHHLDTYPIYFFAASSPFVKHSVRFSENDKRIVSYLVDLPIDGSFRQDMVDKDALQELESFQSKLKDQKVSTNVNLFEETHLNIPLKEYIRKWSNWVIDFHWTFTLKYFIESLPTNKLHFFIKNYPSLDNFILNWMWWSYSLNKDLERFTKDPFRAIGSTAWLCNDINSETIDEQLRSDSKRVKSQTMQTSSSKSSLSSSLSPGQSNSANSRMTSDLPLFNNHDNNNKLHKYSSTISLDHVNMMNQAAYMQQQQQQQQQQQHQQQPIFITYNPVLQNGVAQHYKSFPPQPPNGLNQIPPHQMIAACPSNQNQMIHHQAAFFYHTNQMNAHNMMMNMNVSNITQMKPPSPTAVQQSMRLVQTANSNYQVSYSNYKAYSQQPLQHQQQQQQQQQQQYVAKNNKPEYQVMGNKGANAYKRDRRNSASKNVIEKFTIDAEGNLIKEEPSSYKPNGASRRFAPSQNLGRQTEQNENRRKFKYFERNAAKDYKLTDSAFSPQISVASAPGCVAYETPFGETATEKAIIIEQPPAPRELSPISFVSQISERLGDSSNNDRVVQDEPEAALAPLSPVDPSSSTNSDQDASELEVKQEAIGSRHRSKSLSDVNDAFPTPIARSLSQLMNQNVVAKNLSFVANSSMSTSVSTIKNSTQEVEAGKEEDLDKTIVYFDLSCCSEEQDKSKEPISELKPESPVDDPIEPIEIVVICNDVEPPTSETKEPEVEVITEPESTITSKPEELKMSEECRSDEQQAELTRPLPELLQSQESCHHSSLETETVLKRVLEEKLHIRLPSASENYGESVSSEHEKVCVHSASPCRVDTASPEPQSTVNCPAKPMESSQITSSYSFTSSTSPSLAEIVPAPPRPQIECSYTEIICSNASVVSAANNEQNVFEKFFKSFSQTTTTSTKLPTDSQPDCSEKQPQPSNMNNILDLLKRSSSNHSSLKQEVQASSGGVCYEDTFVAKSSSSSFGDKQNQKESENIIKLLLKIDSNSSYRRSSAHSNETSNEQKNATTSSSSCANFCSLSEPSLLDADNSELYLEKMDESILKCHKTATEASCLKQVLALPVQQPAASLNTASELPGIVVDTKLPASKSSINNLMSLCSSSSSASSSSAVSSAVSSAISISPSSPLFSPKSALSYTPSLSLSTSMTSNESITIKQILQHDTLSVPNGGGSSLSTSLSASSRSSLSSASVSTSSLSSVLSHSHSTASGKISHQRNIIDMLVNDLGANEPPSNSSQRGENSLRIQERTENELLINPSTQAQIDSMLKKIKESNDRCGVNLDTLFRKALPVSPELPESSPLALNLATFQETGDGFYKQDLLKQQELESSSRNQQQNSESSRHSSRQKGTDSYKNINQMNQDPDSFARGPGHGNSSNQSLGEPQKIRPSYRLEGGMVKSASSGMQLASMYNTDAAEKKTLNEEANNSGLNSSSAQVGKTDLKRSRDGNYDSKRTSSNQRHNERHQKRTNSSSRRLSGYEQKDAKGVNDSDQHGGMASNYYNELNAEHRHQHQSSNNNNNNHHHNNHHHHHHHNHAHQHHHRNRHDHHQQLSFFGPKNYQHYREQPRHRQRRRSSSISSSSKKNSANNKYTPDSIETAGAKNEPQYQKQVASNPSQAANTKNRNSESSRSSFTSSHQSEEGSKYNESVQVKKSAEFDDFNFNGGQKPHNSAKIWTNSSNKSSTSSVNSSFARANTPNSSMMSLQKRSSASSELNHVDKRAQSPQIFLARRQDSRRSHESSAKDDSSQQHHAFRHSHSTFYKRHLPAEHEGSDSCNSLNSPLFGHPSTKAANKIKKSQKKTTKFC